MGDLEHLLGVFGEGGISLEGDRVDSVHSAVMVNPYWIPCLVCSIFVVAVMMEIVLASMS